MRFCGERSNVITACLLLSGILPTHFVVLVSHGVVYFPSHFGTSTGYVLLHTEPFCNRIWGKCVLGYGGAPVHINWFQIVLYMISQAAHIMNMPERDGKCPFQTIQAVE